MKINQGEVTAPNPIKIQDTSRQHILKHLYSPFTLSARLQMIGDVKVKQGTQFLMEPLTKYGSEANILV